MVKLALYIKADLQGVTDLQPASDDFEWFFKVVCNSCHEEHPKLVSVNRLDSRDLSTGHDTANFVWRCSSCKRESSAKFDQLPDKKTLKPYQLAQDRGQDFAPIIVLNCRGLEFVGFDPRGTWKCVGAESGTIFSEVEFEDGEWTDYDEKTKEEVGISAIETKWERLK